MAKKTNSNNYETSLLPKASKMSEGDLRAISRLQPQGEGLIPTGLVLCDLCGTPVAGGELSSPNMFEQEMKVGRHFMCHSRYAERETRNAKSVAMRNGTIPKWQDDSLSEEERARMFNTDDSAFSIDTRDVPANNPDIVRTEKPVEIENYYVPPVGSIPLDRVVEQGGLSANDPKNLVAPDNLPEQVAETKKMSTSLDEEMKQLYSHGDPGLQTQDVDNLFPS